MKPEKNTKDWFSGRCRSTERTRTGRQGVWVDGVPGRGWTDHPEICGNYRGHIPSFRDKVGRVNVVAAYKYLYIQYMNDLYYI